MIVADTTARVSGALGEKNRLHAIAKESVVERRARSGRRLLREKNHQHRDQGNHGLFFSLRYPTRVVDRIIPERLARSCRRLPERAQWLEGLPAVIDRLEKEWSLRIRQPFDSEDVSCAWVAPAQLADGSSAIFKIGMPHMEGESEIGGLRFWNGDPAVRLLLADDSANAMLLERCEPGTPLRALPEPDQDVVICELLRRLWRLPPTPHPFRPLATMLDSWSNETLAAAERWPDAGLVYEGLRLFRDLPHTAPTQVLLATDLHAGNVLQAQREPWLVIDPKPFLGDPSYDLTQHLFNCDERLIARPHQLISRIADLAAVDAERLRLWTFARAAAEPRADWGNERLLAIARSVAL